tara:strand:+ start:2805 stop:2975 length:171 start_codon:yes stop_codon:yes gene_type:complete
MALVVLLLDAQHTKPHTYKALHRRLRRDKPCLLEALHIAVLKATEQKTHCLAIDSY